MADGAQIINGVPRFVIGGKPYPISKCRDCGRNIALVPHPRTKNLRPLDSNGQTHFATCPAKKKRRYRPRRIMP